MEALIRGGYERVPMVEGQGQCAIRGDAIVDVFPPIAADALRIEFFDGEIDSLRRFDPASASAAWRAGWGRAHRPPHRMPRGRCSGRRRPAEGRAGKGVGHAMESAAPGHAAPGPDGLSSLDDF